MKTTLRQVRISSVTEDEWQLISFLTPKERMQVLIDGAKKKASRIETAVEDNKAQKERK